MNNQRERILSLYELFPFHEHPLWVGVLNGSLSPEQIVKAEAQHWLRTRAGQRLRREAVEQAAGLSQELFKALLATYIEECTEDQTGPSHLQLVEQLLIGGGMTRDELEAQRNTPGNAAAIAMYREISRRGAACHMLGAGAVEYYYCQLCPRIYDAYTSQYGMTASQAETYRIHGPMDQVHADRALSILDEAIAIHGQEVVEESVRDAFVATSLHYDGMLQAATGNNAYWDGRKK